MQLGRTECGELHNPAFNEYAPLSKIKVDMIVLESNQALLSLP